MQRSPDAGVLVSLKRRHESEGIFFELMDEAGLRAGGSFRVCLPCIALAGDDEGGEGEVEVYYFRLDRDRE